MSDTQLVQAPTAIPRGLTIAEYIVSYPEVLQAAASRLARSFLLPDQLRILPGDDGETKERKLRDVGVLLARCLTTGEDILSLGQSIYLVGGRPALAARYLVARAQELGAIKDAPQYLRSGTWPDISVTASVKSRAGEEHSATVSMQEAREDGWAGRNPKYKMETSAANMLRHRAGARLIDQVAPGVRLGLPVAEEVEDTWERPAARPVDVSPVRVATVDKAPIPDALRGKPAEITKVMDDPLEGLHAADRELVAPLAAFLAEAGLTVEQVDAYRASKGKAPTGTLDDAESAGFLNYLVAKPGAVVEIRNFKPASPAEIVEANQEPIDTSGEAPDAEVGLSIDEMRAALTEAARTRAGLLSAAKKAADINVRKALEAYTPEEVQAVYAGLPKI